jgi:hypothetical protein
METIADDAEEMISELLLLDEVSGNKVPGRLKL